MQSNQQIDEYIAALPEWQQMVCSDVRNMIHTAVPDIQEVIKRRTWPFFVHHGNVAALQATQDHVNVLIYDPIAPDPACIINQGKENATAKAIQIFMGDTVNEAAFVSLIRAVAENNDRGGWRRLI